MQDHRSARKPFLNVLMRRRNPVDGMLVTLLIMLLSAGLLVLFSATYYTAQDSGNAWDEVVKQLLGVGLGTAACVITSRIPYRFWRQGWVVTTGLVLSAVLLVLVIIPGVGVYINGSRRWLTLAGVSFQPSELAKFAIVLYMATVLSYTGPRIRRLWTGIVPVLIIYGLFQRWIIESMMFSSVKE